MALPLPDGWICGINATLKIIRDLDLLMSVWTEQAPETKTL
jgi:hypothetical protein